MPHTANAQSARCWPNSRAAIAFPLFLYAVLTAFIILSGPTSITIVFSPPVSTATIATPLRMAPVLESGAMEKPSESPAVAPMGSPTVTPTGTPSTGAFTQTLGLA